VTSRKIATARKPGHYCDGAGLWLQVAAGAEVGAVTKSWTFRFTSPVTGKVREMGLGSLLTFSVAGARERARELRQDVARGIDPIEAKRSLHAELRRAAVGRMTFAQCAADYLAEHSSGWRSPKHRQQWEGSIARCNDAFGKLDVRDIDVDVLVKFLAPIWRETPETGSRIRGRIEMVLGWAGARKFRAGENPARWKGHLEHLLRAMPNKRHHDAMAFDELSPFMAALRGRNEIAARALEFCILTAARTGEVIGARWDELDETGVWTVPASRMKSGKQHRVPLSKRAKSILRAMPCCGAFIFPGVIEGEPMSDRALRDFLRDGMKVVGPTVHGFRSTFSDWARERTGYPRDVIEMALAHTIKDKSEAAYRRGDALPKRARLMEEWAQYCFAPAVGGKVVALHA
jgi:integrase